MKFRTESVSEEIKLLVTYEIEFQYRDESILLAFFANFGQPKIRCKNKKKDFPRVVLCKCKTSPGDLDGKNQASRYEER